MSLLRSLLLILLLYAYPGPPAASTSQPEAASSASAPGQAPHWSGRAYRWPVGRAYRWPVDAPRVVRPFHPPPQPWLSGHRGVDLAAPPATTIRSAGAGTVVFAGRVAGREVISVAHSDGLRTTYEPVTAVVQVGDQVVAGQAIGALDVGHRGCPASSCLHWGLRRGDQYLDPLALLGRGPVRLLPLDDNPASIGPAQALALASALCGLRGEPVPDYDSRVGIS